MHLFKERQITADMIITDAILTIFPSEDTEVITAGIP